MASEQKLCAVRLKKYSFRAPDFHRASDDLNFTSLKPCSKSKIQCMLEAIKEIDMSFSIIYQKASQLLRSM